MITGREYAAWWNDRYTPFFDGRRIGHQSAARPFPQRLVTREDDDVEPPTPIAPRAAAMTAPQS